MLLLQLVKRRSMDEVKALMAVPDTIEDALLRVKKQASCLVSAHYSQVIYDAMQLWQPMTVLEGSHHENFQPIKAISFPLTSEQTSKHTFALTKS